MCQETKMKLTLPMKMTKSAVCRVSVSLLALAGLALAQDQTPHAWRSVNDPLPAEIDQAPGQPAPPSNVNAQPDPAQDNSGQFNQGPPNPGQPPNPGPP